MRAAGELALPDVRLELGERVLQILREHQIHLLGLKRGEAGRVRDIAAAFDRVQLHMARGVLAASDLVRNRTNFRTERAVQTVEHARLADTRVARKRAHLAADALAQCVNAFAGVRTHAQNLDAALAVSFVQFITRIRVRLVDDNERVHVLVHRNRRHLVDEERVGHRRSRARHNDYQIQIGHSRPNQAVLARRDRLQIAGAVLRLDFQRYPVADDRLAHRFAEPSACFAFNETLGGIHIVETADALQNDPFDQT